MKEADQMVERRELQRQLDKVSLERDRLQRELTLGIDRAIKPMGGETGKTNNSSNEPHLSIDELNNTVSVGERESDEDQGDDDDALPVDDLDEIPDLGGANNSHHNYYDADFDDDDDEDAEAEEQKLQREIDRINERLEISTM